MTLKANDLTNLVHRIFEIDNYRSKMGDDEDVVVLSFTVESRSPAEDLVSFIEKGYDFVLDADMSPGELKDGKYRVFVELQRGSKVSEQISDLLYGMERLTGIDDFKFRYHKSFDSLDAVQERLEEVIPRNALDYKNKIESREVEESFETFFNQSMLESIEVQGDTVQFKKIYAEPIKFNFVTFGKTSTVLESLTEGVAVGLNDMADVMFLTKYLGNYNINKIGNRYMFENNGHSLILERI
jgi:hypothetical protein